MPYEVQETLLTINSQCRTSYHDELAEKLFAETQRAYSRRQISQSLSRHKFVNISASHLAPMERDEEFRRNWIELTVCIGGPVTAKQLIFVDESNKKRRDAVRRRVNCAKDDKITIPVVHRNSGNAASVIASMSIEGAQTVTAVDTSSAKKLSCLSSAHVACNMFEHCFIHVTEDERTWANR